MQSPYRPSGADVRSSGVPSSRSEDRTDSSFLPPGAGIDKIALTFPVADWERDVTAWERADSRDPGLASERLALSTLAPIPGVGACVFVSLHPTPRGAWGRIEWNPSRLVDACGFSLASVSAALETALAPWRVMTDLLAPASTMEHALVKRLDVARDFNVTNAAPILGALLHVPRRWARTAVSWIDPRTGRVQSIRVGGRSALVRLYDKQAESPSLVPTPLLRWEAQADHQWLRTYGGIKRLADLTEPAVGQLAANRWAWSRMGDPVTGLHGLVAAASKLGLSQSRECSFMGFLMLTSLGARPLLSGRTSKEYERLARTLGALPAPPWDFTAAVRLDWLAGSEVSHAA